MVALEWLAKALPFIQKYWKETGCVLAILFGWLSWHLWGRVKALEAAQVSKPPVVVASQQQTGALEAKATAKLIAKPGPARPCPAGGECPPCPEFAVEFGADSAAKGSQAQVVTVTPKVDNPYERHWALWGGGAYTKHTDETIATASLQYGDFVLDGGVGITGNWQLGVKARFFEWK